MWYAEPMRILGIDFGHKKVGVALTDDAGMMAFPHSVFPNDDELLPTLERLITEKEVKEVVIGHSLNKDGTENPIHNLVTEFIGDLSLRTPVPIHLHPEQYSTQEAIRIQGRNEQTDAAAATVILNSYLTQQKTMSEDTTKEPETTAAEETPVEPTVPMISYKDFIKLDIRLGTITAVEIVEDADKLLKLTVDLGEESSRQIVSGIREFFADPQSLVGKQSQFLANLEPRKIRGLESQGMILAAGDGESFTLLHPDQPQAPGTEVR